MRIGVSRIICRDFSEKKKTVFAKSRAECSNFSTAKPPLQGGLVVEKLRARTISKYSTVYCTVPGTQKYEPHSVRIAGHSRLLYFDSSCDVISTVLRVYVILILYRTSTILILILP